MCELSLNLEDYKNISLIVIPIVVAFISYKQYRVNKEKYSVDYHKFRLDLFEKRYQVFENTLNLYKQLVEGNVTDECLNSFNISYNSSFFLYPKDSGVYDVMDEIHEKTIATMGLRSAMRNINTYQHSDDNSRELLAKLGFLSKQIEVLKNKLEPYLSFSDFKTNS